MALDLARARAITGYMDDDELKWLARAARECQTIIEVGSYQGRSTRALADHCPGVVFAVDPWDGGYENDDGTQAKWIDTKAALAAFEANLADHLASGHVVALQGTLKQAMVRLEKAGVMPRGRAIGKGHADMVFIDGDHRYKAVSEDIALARRLVRPGGGIAGHDYGREDWPGVKRAVDKAFPSVKAVKSVSVLNTIWWAKV